MKKFFLYVMILFYLGAGINHFWHPAFYLQIMPYWLPWHSELVILSGCFELLFALLLLFDHTRRVAAWGIIIFLIAVFPANIQMMQNYSKEQGLYFWISIIRLPFQAILIWWAYIFTKTESKN